MGKLNGPNTLTILLNNGNGFTPISPSLTVSNGPFVAGDFNGDGKLDIAISDSVNKVGILIGNGDGTFNPISLTVTGLDFISTLAVGDFNGDGKLDLAGVEPRFTMGRVLINNGNGTYQPSPIFAAPGAIDLAVGDFNNDGRLDIAAPSSGSINSYGYLKFNVSAPAVGLLLSRQGAAGGAVNRWAGIRTLHKTQVGVAQLTVPMFNPFCGF